MKKAAVRLQQPIIADGQATEVAPPANRALHDPAASVPAQFPAILVRGLSTGDPRRNDGLNPASDQPDPDGITVISPIRNQSVWPLARAPRPVRACHRNRVEGRFEEPDFRRGYRIQVCSQRSTRDIDHDHPLGALASLRRPDFGAPFFAGAKLPSTKHSFQRSFCWSLSWARKARHRASSTPVVSHCRRRRQHVVGLPYRLGSSLQGAPVHRIQRMPSKQRRASAGGRPLCGERLAVGRWGRIWSHCGSVRWRHAIGSPFVKGAHGADSTSLPQVLK